VMRATIDVDSFPIQVHGHQQGSSYNGYYRDTVYHPLVASFSVDGDYDSTRAGHRLGNGFMHAVLRKGEVHTTPTLSCSKSSCRHVKWRVVLICESMPATPSAS